MKNNNHPWARGFNKKKAKGNKPIGARGNVDKTVALVVERERGQSTESWGAKDEPTN